jgi:hypothetical protein
MRLFEQFCASEFVLKAATAAISVAEENDQSLVRVTLYVCKKQNQLNNWRVSLSIRHSRTVHTFRNKPFELHFPIAFFASK